MKCCRIISGKSFGRYKSESLKKSIPALPREVFALLAELLPDRSGDTEKASVIFEKGLYGKGQLKKEEADFFIQYAKEILSALKKS